MRQPKTIIFLGDGMADEPVAALGGKTPLQHALTPAMDSIAQGGCSGTLLTLPEGFPTSSEVANMSVLGCDLKTEYCGRGPLEAAGKNIKLAADDIAFRLNLVTIEDGVLKDYSGGQIGQDDADCVIAALNKAFGGDTVRFHSGVSYRNILVLSGSRFSHRVGTEKPDDNHGELVADHFPVPENSKANCTADFLRKLMIESGPVLKEALRDRKLTSAGKPAANGVWPWSGGKAGALHSLKEKYGITGAVISAVSVIQGLGRCLGMDVIEVPGATGYIDTNYDGKAEAAIKTIKTHDLVYVHLEAIDEVSHEKNLELKLKAIEDLDSRVVGPVLAAVGPGVNAAILPDHPVPVATGKHTRTPVPVAVRKAGMKPDPVASFDEISCLRGSLGAMKDGDLMNLLFRE